MLLFNPNINKFNGAEKKGIEKWAISGYFHYVGILLLY